MVGAAAFARGAMRRSRVARRTPSLSRETERAALGVAADRPALARVHDAPSELDDALERLREIRDAEVRQREAITRAPATLVQQERRASLVGLQALAFPLPPLVERDVEQRLPEAAGAGQVVSRELDQLEWHGGRPQASRHVTPPRIGKSIG